MNGSNRALRRPGPDHPPGVVGRGDSPTVSSTPSGRSELDNLWLWGKAGTNSGRLHNIVAITMKVCERLEPD